ncbi:MAG: hypothetical protein L0H73_04725 [Nitrococcus sp.]|nr:hypothetical protein [Nitrococcus sp.]
MGAGRDLMDFARRVLRLTEEVEALGEDVAQLQADVRSHERRLIRIETVMELAQQGRLKSPDER